MLKFGTYFYDDSIDNHSDNVQWVAGFLLDPYIKSPYWKIIQKVSFIHNILFPTYINVLGYFFFSVFVYSLETRFIGL